MNTNIESDSIMQLLMDQLVSYVSSRAVHSSALAFNRACCQRDFMNFKTVTEIFFRSLPFSLEI